MSSTNGLGIWGTSLYKLPKHDHAYHIKDTNYIKQGIKAPKTYMTQIIHRAKSTVDPRKYIRVRDWGVDSKI